MIKLEIKNTDGSIYWTEHFNSQQDCDKWLNEERTRKYWKPEFTSSSADMNPIDPVKEEEKRIAKEQELIQKQLKEQNKLTRIGALKALDFSKVTKISDIVPILQTITDLLKDEE